MSGLSWLEMAIGLSLVWIVLRDLFVGVIVPRPARGALRPSNLLVQWSWRAWRWIGNRSTDVVTREARLGAFGPAALILLLVAWVLGLIIGYGLIPDAGREQVTARPPDLRRGPPPRRGPGAGEAGAASPGNDALLLGHLVLADRLRRFRSGRADGK